MSLAQPTLEDVWMLFRETDRRFQETERLMKESSQETDRRFQEADRRFQEIERIIKENHLETERILKEKSLETDLKFQETDLKFQETDRRFQETERLMKEASQETERLMKEAARKTDRQIEKVTKAIGELGHTLGAFVEWTVRPAAVRLFQARGIDVHEVYQNIIAKRDNDEIEIDLLVVNDSEAVVIECKNHLSIDDVNDHIKLMEKFKKLLPKYAQLNVFGAVAGIILPNEVARYAYRKGFFVISQTGENLLIRNDEKFIPKIW